VTVNFDLHDLDLQSTWIILSKNRQAKYLGRISSNSEVIFGHGHTDTGVYRTDSFTWTTSEAGKYFENVKT